MKRDADLSNFGFNSPNDCETLGTFVISSSKVLAHD